MPDIALAECPICGCGEARSVVSFPELVFSECPSCGAIYRSHENAEKLAARYDEEYFTSENSARYDRRFEHRTRKATGEILLALESAGGMPGRVLDVGCSTGYVLEAAKRLGLEATGIDVSEFAVDECRKKGYDARLADIAETGLPDGSCRIATLKFVLEHTPTPQESLRETARVLAPGGAVYIAVPSGRYWKAMRWPRRYNWFRPDRGGAEHFVYFTPLSLRLLLEKTGFGDVRFDGAYFLRKAVRSLRRGVFAESIRFGGSMFQRALFALLPGLRKSIVAVARKLPLL